MTDLVRAAIYRQAAAHYREFGIRKFSRYVDIRIPGPGCLLGVFDRIVGIQHTHAELTKPLGMRLPIQAFTGAYNTKWEGDKEGYTLRAVNYNNAPKTTAEDMAQLLEAEAHDIELKAQIASAKEVVPAEPVLVG